MCPVFVVMADCVPNRHGEAAVTLTEEVVSAGALALASYTEMFDTLEIGAERIFRAMAEAAGLKVSDVPRVPTHGDYSQA